MLDESEGGVGSTMLDYDKRLTFGVDPGAVKGVARDDLDVFGEVSLKGGDFGGLGGSLTADDGAYLS